MHSRNGFSLVEVLIVLVILATVSSFGVSKVMNESMASKSYTATQNVKRVAMMVEFAYEQFRNGRTVAEVTTLKPYSLTPYMNYVSIDTSSVLDDSHPPFGTQNCANTSAITCLKLHDGGTLLVQAALCI